MSDPDHDIMTPRLCGTILAAALLLYLIVCAISGKPYAVSP